MSAEIPSQAEIARVMSYLSRKGRQRIEKACAYERCDKAFVGGPLAKYCSGACRHAAYADRKWLEERAASLAQQEGAAPPQP